MQTHCTAQRHAHCKLLHNLVIASCHQLRYARDSRLGTTANCCGAYAMSKWSGMSTALGCELQNARLCSGQRCRHCTAAISLLAAASEASAMFACRPPPVLRRLSWPAFQPGAAARFGALGASAASSCRCRGLATCSGAANAANGDVISPAAGPSSAQAVRLPSMHGCNASRAFSPPKNPNGETEVLRLCGVHGTEQQHAPPW